LYVSETLSVTLRDEYRLRISEENTVKYLFKVFLDNKRFEH